VETIPLIVLLTLLTCAPNMWLQRRRLIVSPGGVRCKRLFGGLSCPPVVKLVDRSLRYDETDPDSPAAHHVATGLDEPSFMNRGARARR
jgi:hypothetical protein